MPVTLTISSDDKKAESALDRLAGKFRDAGGAADEMGREGAGAMEKVGASTQSTIGRMAKFWLTYEVGKKAIAAFYRGVKELADNGNQDFQAFGRSIEGARKQLLSIAESPAISSWMKALGERAEASALSVRLLVDGVREVYFGVNVAAERAEQAAQRGKRALGNLSSAESNMKLGDYISKINDPRLLRDMIETQKQAMQSAARRGVLTEEGEKETIARVMAMHARIRQIEQKETQKKKEAYSGYLKALDDMDKNIEAKRVAREKETAGKKTAIYLEYLKVMEDADAAAGKRTLARKEQEAKAALDIERQRIAAMQQAQDARVGRIVGAAQGQGGDMAQRLIGSLNPRDVQRALQRRLDARSRDLYAGAEGEISDDMRRQLEAAGGDKAKQSAAYNDAQKRLRDLQRDEQRQYRVNRARSRSGKGITAEDYAAAQSEVANREIGKMVLGGKLSNDQGEAARRLVDEAVKGNQATIEGNQMLATIANGIQKLVEQNGRGSANRTGTNRGMGQRLARGI